MDNNSSLVKNRLDQMITAYLEYWCAIAGVDFLELKTETVYCKTNKTTFTSFYTKEVGRLLFDIYRTDTQILLMKYYPVPIQNFESTRWEVNLN